MKNTVFGIIALGAIGSLIASQIERPATVKDIASRTANFFVSTISIPPWVPLLTLIFLISIGCYICVLINRNAQQRIASIESKFSKKTTSVENQNDDSLMAEKLHKEKDKSKSASDFEVLNEMNQIRLKVSEIFSAKNKTFIIQTFIKANTLPPVLDKIRDFYNIFKRENISLEHKLKRIICISHSREIYFVNESLKFAEKMGNYFNVALFHLTDQEKSPLHTFPNFTLDNNNVLISFPLEEEINTRQLSFPLFSENNSIESSGILVKNKDFNILTRKYLDVLITQIEKSQRKNNWEILKDAKKYFWDSDPWQYLDSIARDISKEILKTTSLEKSILYIGLVGSLVESLNNKTDKIPNDIDLIMCIDKISVEKYNSIEHSFGSLKLTP